MWLICGGGLPLLATVSLLLRVDSWTKRAVRAADAKALRAQGEQDGELRAPVPPGRGTKKHGPAEATLIESAALARSANTTARAPHRPTNQSLARSFTDCAVPPARGAAEAAAAVDGRTAKAGASIAVHPPKFYAAAGFLEQFAACPAARQSLSVYLVFTTPRDKELFEEVIACLHPAVSQDAWAPVVALPPPGGWSQAGGYANQIIAAYKKWYGLVHMMDRGTDAEAYGLMLDSELLLYDSRDCGPHGSWSKLFDRIRANDEGKTFPAARVSDTLTTYSFGRGREMSGQDYDRGLIRQSAAFVTRGASVKGCKTPPCLELNRQIDQCLFSWWTDLPWLNLTVAKDMLTYLAKGQPTEGWRHLASGIRFSRFEYIGYQQWCVLHEGFTFRDVTNITGEAKWGSYMEDPLPGARLAELRPLWVSSQALDRVEGGTLPRLSEDSPPLIIFHADQGPPRANRDGRRRRWAELLVAGLSAQKRTEYVNELKDVTR